MSYTEIVLILVVLFMLYKNDSLKRKNELALSINNNHYEKMIIEPLKKKNTRLENTLKKSCDLSFWIFDSLHNITSKEEDISKDYKKDTKLSQVRLFLSQARYLTRNKRNLEDDDNYKQLLDFVKNDLGILGDNGELFDEDRLKSIWKNYEKYSHFE